MRRGLLSAALLLGACSDDGVGLQPWDLGQSHTDSKGSETGYDSEDAGVSDDTGAAGGASSGAGPWSPVDDSSGSDEGGSEGSGSTGGPPDVGEPCPPDPNEPSDAMAHASDFGKLEDCNADEHSISGVLDGPADVDWVRYSGDDVFFCSVDPTRSLQTEASLRVCKFAHCNGGTTEVMCPSGTQDTQLPNGMPGCCADHGFEMWLDCPGLDDEADIFVRIDQGTAACQSYTLAVHY